MISAHSSLQKCSRSVRLWGLLLCTYTALWGCSVRLPQMFSQIQVWAFPKLLLVKPHLVSFGCIRWVRAKMWHFSFETWRFGAIRVCCVAPWVKRGGKTNFSWRKAAPKPDAASSVLHCEWCSLDDLFWIAAKKAEPWFRQIITYFPTCSQKS